jgi:hypothetical protein
MAADADPFSAPHLSLDPADGGHSTVANNLRSVTSALALAAATLAASTAHAVNFGDMFNPGRWFGGGDDDYYYEEGPWGPYGPGPYGYGAPGYGPYGAPGYGYGGVPYGYAPGVAPGVAPGYAAPAAPAAPAATSDAKDQEIEALKRRIEQLETRQSAPPPAPRSSEGWPSAPAFRPMDQY